MNAVIGQLIAAGSTNETQLVITNTIPSSAGNRVPVEFLIEVVSGTIKFGKGGVHASAHGYGDGDKVIITCPNGQLYFQASNAADTFVVNV